MIEEDYIIGEDNSSEVLAQLMYENRRLKNELDSLNRNILGYEENIDSLSSDLQEKEEALKSVERRITTLSQAVEDRNDVNSHLEKELVRLRETNENLENMIGSHKSKERDLKEQIEILLLSLEELTEKHGKIEEENSELKVALKSQSEDNILHTSFISDLRRQVKILEEENALLQERVELLVSERHSAAKLTPPSLLFMNSNNSSPVHRRLDFSSNSDGSSIKNECSLLSLKEEFLMAEVGEKDRRINHLEEKLCDTERKMHEISNAMKYIDEILPLLDSNKDFQIVSPVLKVTYNKIIAELRCWADGQAGENNCLTEGPDSVKVKEAVISVQPVPIRLIESVSTATQTDRLLLAKALEELNPLQHVLDHKYGDVDMDLYRSYRKLSILPEEEDDETFKRIPSLKNAINSKSFSAKIRQSSKTHSADDILNFDKRSVNCPTSEKFISSCTSIILSGRENALNGHVRETNSFQDSLDKSGNDFLLICDNKLCETSNFNKSEERSVINLNESQLDSLDPLEALRQPHSFDSYLDPQQVHSSSLPRQISDPTQNTAFDPPLTRRGSYLKRPRSTCRPLRLPCENSGIKKEERTSKVRFDLSNDSKPNDNMNGSKGPMPPSNLKNHRKIERISRFTVERVDEDEFRKSIEESNKTTNRKRPPLIHSVVYKKSVLHDMTVYDPERSLGSPEGLTARLSVTSSPDSPSYETATENSPVGSFDMATYESNYLIADIYPCKRRKQSDSSSYSTESQDSIDGNDILVKSIRLHSNSEYITMKELDEDSSTSSHLSMGLDIPYIDSEELPVIKPSPEVIKRSFDTAKDGLDEDEDNNLKSTSPKLLINQSDSSETFVTAYSDVTPTSDTHEMSLSPPKASGLSKSPTVLKNLSNFELYKTVSESLTLGKRSSQSIRTQTVQEEETSHVNGDSMKAEDDHDEEEEESTILKLTSSDVSEMSDTVTYVTVKSEPSNHLLSSDCDSDTYVTIQSDKSTLERKFSDFSENSSSPYNTPPDTSSASFCTPPDTYSPILSRLAKHFGTSYGDGDSPRARSSSPYRTADYNSRSDHSKYDTPPNVSPFSSPPCSSPFTKNNYGLFGQENIMEAESVTIYNIDDSNYPSERTEFRERKELIMFDSPKLEFYETNDSIEDLEAFLQAEEGVMEQVKTPASDRSWRLSSLEDLQEEPERIERKNSDADEGSGMEVLSKANSFDCPSGVDSKILEKRGKRHPPLSRQNSTEEYNFLEPHDSCLNLSEEISSPSTTPDTSNKTVIFKNKPLTISNTIDLEDDDFPISESEIQINFNGSETEIVEICIGESTNKRYDIYSCRSEPCIPSISSSSTARLPKQSSSMTDDDPNPRNSSRNTLPVPPEIIVSNLSSESDSESDVPGGILIDFASNASERSEINLSDLNSMSAQSDNASSISDPSENALSERSPEMQLTDPEVSLSVSPDVSDNSSSSSAHIHELEMETFGRPASPTDGDNLFVDVHADVSSVGSLRVVDDASCSSTREEETTRAEPTIPVKDKLNHMVEEEVNLAAVDAGCAGNLNEDLDNVTSGVDMMSGQNNVEDLTKSSRDCIRTTGNLNEETTRAEPTIPVKDKLNHMVEEEVNLAAVDAGCAGNLNEDLDNVTSGVDIDGNCILSEEEVKKKFDELSLALRTDSMMLQKRLIIRKRFRDQAELNVEKEINIMKTKLNSLLCLRFDAEFLEQLTELKRLLDIISASVTHLAGCAEAYGCVQTEKNISAAVAIITHHVEHIERMKAEICKSPEREKPETKRTQLVPIMDDAQEEMNLRRRSVASLALNGPTRRRASIASVVRNSLSSDDSSGGLNGWHLPVNSGSSNGLVRKRVSSSSGSSKPSSSFAATDQPARSRKESRTEDSFGVKYVQDYGNGHSVGSESGDYLLSSDEETPMEGRSETQRAVLRMSGSFKPDNRMCTSFVACKTLNIIDSLRGAIKWTLKQSRFQFPENIHQYVPFFITWFVMTLIVAVFLSGFFAGLNQCSISELSHTSWKIAAFTPSAVTLVSLVAKRKPLRYLALTGTVMYVHYLYHVARDHGMDGLLMRLGIKILSYSPEGAPV